MYHIHISKQQGAEGENPGRAWSTWFFSSCSLILNNLQKLLGCFVYTHIPRRFVDLPSSVIITLDAIVLSHEITLYILTSSIPPGILKYIYILSVAFKQ